MLYQCRSQPHSQVCQAQVRAKTHIGGRECLQHVLHDLGLLSGQMHVCLDMDNLRCSMCSFCSVLLGLCTWSVQIGVTVLRGSLPSIFSASKDIIARQKKRVFAADPKCQAGMASELT